MVKVLLRGVTRCFLWREEEGWVGESIMMIAKCCPRLRHVDFSMNESITDDHIVALVQNCPCIETFELPFQVRSKLTPASLVAIAEGCPRLTQIDFQSLKIHMDVYHTVATKCPLLNSVSIDSLKLQHLVGKGVDQSQNSRPSPP